jgi:hypothetical protein
MSGPVIDFDAARRRIEAMSSEVHCIEIDAARIPVVHEIEITPVATFLERFERSLSHEEILELMQVTLEESK